MSVTLFRDNLQSRYHFFFIQVCRNITQLTTPVFIGGVTQGTWTRVLCAMFSRQISLLLGSHGSGISIKSMDRFLIIWTPFRDSTEITTQKIISRILRSFLLWQRLKCQVFTCSVKKYFQKEASTYNALEKDIAVLNVYFGKSTIPGTIYLYFSRVGQDQTFGARSWEFFWQNFENQPC